MNPALGPKQAKQARLAMREFLAAWHEAQLPEALTEADHAAALELAVRNVAEVPPYVHKAARRIAAILNPPPKEPAE